MNNDKGMVQWHCPLMPSSTALQLDCCFRMYQGSLLSLATCRVTSYCYLRGRSLTYEPARQVEKAILDRNNFNNTRGKTFTVNIKTWSVLRRSISSYFQFPFKMYIIMTSLPFMWSVTCFRNVEQQSGFGYCITLCVLLTAAAHRDIFILENTTNMVGLGQVQVTALHLVLPGQRAEEAREVAERVWQQLSSKAGGTRPVKSVCVDFPVLSCSSVVGWLGLWETVGLNHKYI